MRRMSTASLMLERFKSWSSSASLTPWLFLYHFSDSGFMMCCKSELNQSVLSGSPCLVLRLRWDCWAINVGVASNLLTEFYVHQCSINHRLTLSSKLSILVFVLSHDINKLQSNGEWKLFRYIQLFSGHHVVTIDKFTKHTPEIFCSFHRVAISFRNIRNSTFFLPRVTPCLSQT